MRHNLHTQIQLTISLFLSFSSVFILLQTFACQHCLQRSAVIPAEGQSLGSPFLLPFFLSSFFIFQYWCLQTSRSQLFFLPLCLHFPGPYPPKDMIYFSIKDSYISISVLISNSVLWIFTCPHFKWSEMHFFFLLPIPTGNRFILYLSENFKFFISFLHSFSTIC